MSEKIDALVGRLEGLVETWIVEFEKAPVRTLVRVLVIVTLVKWIKQAFTHVSIGRR